MAPHRRLVEGRHLQPEFVGIKKAPPLPMLILRPVDKVRATLQYITQTYGSQINLLDIKSGSNDGCLDDDTAPIVTWRVYLRGGVSWAVIFEASRQLSGTLVVEIDLGSVHRSVHAKDRQGVRRAAARTDNRV
jgi:hypothetical protein